MTKREELINGILNRKDLYWYYTTELYGDYYIWGESYNNFSILFSTKVYKNIDDPDEYSYNIKINTSSEEQLEFDIDKEYYEQITTRIVNEFNPFLCNRDTL